MRTMPLLGYAAVVFLASLATACERKAGCPDCDEAKHAQGAQLAATTPAVKKLEPWETIDERFNGCAGGCGLRMAGPTDDVVAQPGVAPGQSTYCLVSGVAFKVQETTVRRQVGGKTLYFCCEGCAAYFTANQASVLAARGIAS